MATAFCFKWLMHEIIDSTIYPPRNGVTASENSCRENTGRNRLCDHNFCLSKISFFR